MAEPSHNEKPSKASSSEDSPGRAEIENVSPRGPSEGHRGSLTAEQLRANINAKIANPLAGYSRQEMMERSVAYCKANQIGGEEDIRAFRIGAILAQNPNRHAELEETTDEEKAILTREITHKWSQPKLLYMVIALCSTCAAVQGMGLCLPSLPSMKHITDTELR